MTTRTRRSTFAIIAAMALASLPMLTLSTDGRLLPAIVGAIVALQGLAWLLRMLGLPNGWANFAQLVAFVSTMTWWWLSLGDQQLGRIERFGEVADATIRVILENPAPLEAHDGMLVLLVTLMGLLTILADLLLVTTWSPAMAGVATLSPFLVPAIILRADLSWWYFPASAAAWIILLVTDGTLQANDWSRNLVGDPDAPRDRRGGRVIGTAIQLGVLVIAASFLAGSWLPTLGDGRWQGFGSGRSGNLTLVDPTIDLQQNLRRPTNDEVLTYTTAHPGGLYLRLTSLPVVSSSGWHPEALTLTQQQPEAVPGRGQVPASVEADISIGEFATPYLPAPYAPVRYTVPGRWSHDPISLMIFNTGPDNQNATRNLSYRVSATDQGPGEAALAAAQAGVPEGAESTAIVPADVPVRIIELANRIARESLTDGEKALALQNYLRDPERFTYSLEAPLGLGYDVISNFLFRDRAGYCTHFAASMALMARAVGIPARVAVGFMPGTFDGERYVVRAHDMHAWPELYFNELGWVRYEPTVSIADAPAWSDGTSDDLPNDPADEPSESPVPEEELDEIPRDQESAEPTPGDEVPEATIELEPTFPIWPLVAILAVAAAPAGVRAVRRRWRLRRRGDADHIEGAWAEARDSLIDLGVEWPDGTPGEAADALLAVAQPESDSPLPAESAASIRELATLVERARYARQVPDAARAVELIDEASEPAAATISPAKRALARALPRSLWAGIQHSVPKP